MRRKAYRLIDEPSPGAMARIAVEPIWPLLALMLAGNWLGMPWLALNGFAVGSPTRWRESMLAALGLLGSFLLAFGLSYAWQARFIESEHVLRYALLSLVVWKLALGYLIFSLQSATIELYQYYGGVLGRFGLPVALLGGFLLRGMVLGLFSSSIWFLVLS